MTADELATIVREYRPATEVLTTNNGHKLSPKEHMFINSFMINGDAAIAAKDAGFIPQGTRTLKSIGERVLKKDYIYDEILYRIDEMNAASIANEQEVMQYFTSVMRGEEKDQFGLDVSIADRTAAAKELAKRIIDIPQKQVDNAIQINLNWQRDAIEVVDGV